MSETITPDPYKVWIEMPVALDVMVVLLAVVTVAAIAAALVLSRSPARSALARIRLSMLIRLPSMLGTMAILIGVFSLAFGLDVWGTASEGWGYGPDGLREGLDHACLLFFWSTIVCATGLAGTWLSGWVARRSPVHPPAGD